MKTCVVNGVLRLYENKVCSKCGEKKPLKQFYRNRAQADGYDNNCKVCANRYKAKPITGWNPYRLITNEEYEMNVRLLFGVGKQSAGEYRRVG
jgi:hypothetical protein